MSDSTAQPESPDRARKAAVLDAATDFVDETCHIIGFVPSSEMRQTTIIAATALIIGKPSARSAWAAKVRLV